MSKTSKTGAPRWEKMTMIVSFLGVWAWFVARQIALNKGQAFSVLWQIPLVLCLGLLIWIFVRRTRRAVAGLKENHPARRGPAERN